MASNIKVEGIELEIKAQATDASARVGALEESLKNLKETVKGGLGLNSVVSSIKRLNEALSAFDMGKLKELTENLERLKDVKDVKVSVKGDTSVGETSAATPETLPARPAEKVVSPPKITGTYKDIFAGLTGTKTKKEEKGFYDFSKALKTAGSSAGKSALGFAKLGAAIKRIAIYRAIRAAIKAVTQALKEGTVNAYQYSKAISGPLAKNMDAIATSVQFLKNGLGAGLAPLINALTPIITALADSVARLGNAIAGFLAMVTGQSTYVKAIKYATEYADATEGAAKAQKQLLGFDELNVLSDKGGSGGTSVDYSKMFETVDTSTFTDNLKKSLSELPQLISSKLKEALHKASEAIRSVDWGGLPGKIASAIKTVFENFDFTGVFKGIGELIGSALAAAVSFGKSVAGLVGGYFKGYVDAELGGLDKDASILQIGGAVVSGILKGIWDGMVSVVGWVYANVVSPIVEGLRSGFATTMGPAWDELKFQFRYAFAKVYGWWTLQKEKFFTSGAWLKVFKPIYEALDPVVEKIKEVWESLQEWLDSHGLKLSLAQNDFGYQLGEKVREAIAGAASKAKSSANSRKLDPTGTVSMGGYASGGYPAMGSVFLAGEAGPEIVSEINGRTGVINNDQFGSIVAAAAENIINAILSSSQGVAEAAREGGNVYLDKTLVSRSLYGALQSEGTRLGPNAISIG